MSEMRSTKPAMTEKLEVRVPPDQKQRVVEAAERQDITVGQFVRRAVIKALAETAQAA